MPNTILNWMMPSPRTWAVSPCKHWGGASHTVHSVRRNGGSSGDEHRAESRSAGDALLARLTLIVLQRKGGTDETFLHIPCPSHSGWTHHFRGRQGLQHTPRVPCGLVLHCVGQFHSDSYPHRDIHKSAFLGRTDLFVGPLCGRRGVRTV